MNNPTPTPPANDNAALRWRSVATWPPSINLGTSANESDDEHDTREGAEAVCAMLKARGFGGEGRVFPLSVRVEPIPSAAPTTRTEGAADVLRERQKQAVLHGDAHDDEHDAGELVWNALECANFAVGYEIPIPGVSWGLGEKHAADRRQLLVIAAALLIAEIERTDRIKAKTCTECGGIGEYAIGDDLHDCCLCHGTGVQP